MVTSPGERIEFPHLGTVVHDTPDASLRLRDVAERAFPGDQIDPRTQHEVVMQDNVIRDAQSPAQVAHPCHHLH